MLPEERPETKMGWITLEIADRIAPFPRTLFGAGRQAR